MEIKPTGKLGDIFNILTIFVVSRISIVSKGVVCNVYMGKPASFT